MEYEDIQKRLRKYMCKIQEILDDADKHGVPIQVQLANQSSLKYEPFARLDSSCLLVGKDQIIADLKDQIANLHRLIDKEYGCNNCKFLKEMNAKIERIEYECQSRIIKELEGIIEVFPDKTMFVDLGDGLEYVSDYCTKRIDDIRSQEFKKKDNP